MPGSAHSNESITRDSSEFLFNPREKSHAHATPCNTRFPFAISPRRPLSSSSLPRARNGALFIVDILLKHPAKGANTHRKLEEENKTATKSPGSPDRARADLHCTTRGGRGGRGDNRAYAPRVISTLPAIRRHYVTSDKKRAERAARRSPRGVAIANICSLAAAAVATKTNPHLCVHQSDVSRRRKSRGARMDAKRGKSERERARCLSLFESERARETESALRSGDSGRSLAFRSTGTQTARSCIH